MKHFTFDVVKFPPVRVGEWFEAGDWRGTWRHAWDVTAANRMMLQLAGQDVNAGRVPSRIVRIVLHGFNLRMLEESGTETDAAYMASDACDPRRPILIVTLDGREWIIDGWHRARRAAAMGWPELPAFLLTAAEDKACRICACCRRDGQAVTIDGMQLRIPRRLQGELMALEFTRRAAAPRPAGGSNGSEV